MKAGGTSTPRRGGESGQTTALVACMLLTLTLFVGLVVNVGQLVNRRVSLQLVADSGAWSGATVQAVQLNHYAFWSRMVQNAYSNASGLSFGFVGSECVSGWTAVGSFYAANGGMVLAAARFRGKAESEAKRHSLFNIDDLFPGERDNFDFSTTAYANEGSVSAPDGGNIFPFPLTSGKLTRGDHEWERETPLQVGIELTQTGLKYSLFHRPFLNPSASLGTKGWPCYTPPATFGYVTMYVTPVSPPGWRLQKLLKSYIFVWKVKERKPTKALFFDWFFGPNAIPPMTAVAVAKAVGGHVKEGRSRYRVKMIPVSRYGSGSITDVQARPGRAVPNTIRVITH